MTALYRQNGELFEWCREFLGKLCIYNVHNLFVKYSTHKHPHKISQYCRKELWCRFPYSFRLSSAKGNLINDDRGTGTFSSTGVYILWIQSNC